MLQIDIPGFGTITLKQVFSDFTGTLSVGGVLLPSVEKKLNQVAEFLDVTILTADTFGVAKKQLQCVNCAVHILPERPLDIEKERYLNQAGAEQSIALGNGINDRLMLRAARVGIVVCEGEGCAVKAAQHGDILVNRAVDALDLLLEPKRLKATLRF